MAKKCRKPHPQAVEEGTKRLFGQLIRPASFFKFDAAAPQP
jgi:hypothetical protein